MLTLTIKGRVMNTVMLNKKILGYVINLVVLLLSVQVYAFSLSGDEYTKGLAIAKETERRDQGFEDYIVVFFNPL